MSPPLFVLSDSSGVFSLLVNSCLASPLLGSAIAAGSANILAALKPIRTMVARLRAYFMQPETLTLPFGLAPMRKGFSGILQSMTRPDRRWLPSLHVF